MWNRLISVVEEQAQTLIRTAFGAATREAGDLSAGLFLPDGRMIAQAVTGTPGHVNSMAESVKHFLAEFPLRRMHAGDVFITNDPWKGTGHLNDLTMVTPVFKLDALVALFAATVHVVDIGGLGFGPDGMQIYHEGLFIPIIRLVDRGRMSDPILRMIKANVREPIQVEGDIFALIACNEIGGRRLLTMMAEYDLVRLERLGEYIIEHSRRAMLEAIAHWPTGTYRNTMVIDGYDHPLSLVAQLTISRKGIDIDFTGTSPVVARGINVPKSYTDAYTSFGVRCIIGADVPNNAGSLGVVRVTAPENCIVNAQYPLAVASRAIIGQMLPDVVFGCLRQACPDQVPAEGASSLWNIRLAGGQPLTGAPAEEFLRKRRFTVVCFTTGGTGARPSKDGLSTTSFPSGVKNVAVEIIETLSPLVFWRKQYRVDSGGPGAQRGGLGQTIEIENGDEAPMILAATFDRIAHPARGALGGLAGGAGRVRLASGKVLAGKGRQLVPKGDRVIIETPGGGGYGDPRRRHADAVAADLRAGLISAETARNIYGLAASSGSTAQTTATKRSYRKTARSSS
ncbi:MAG: hydantoinase B/oxoprolinase family protein [Burkholderiales bacterium]|nr:hydantoinase B/oxoprolinase family protein [Burkholderiales bacterium]